MSIRKELKEKLWRMACPSQTVISRDLVKEMTLDNLIDPEWHFFLREFIPPSAVDENSTCSISCQHFVWLKDI